MLFTHCSGGCPTELNKKAQTNNHLKVIDLYQEFLKRTSKSFVFQSSISSTFLTQAISIALQKSPKCNKTPQHLQGFSPVALPVHTIANYSLQNCDRSPSAATENTNQGVPMQTHQVLIFTCRGSISINNGISITDA